MALDDATATLIAGMAEAGGPPLHELSPEAMRGFGAGLQELYGPGPEMASVRELDADGVPVRLLVPEGDVRGLIVYYHGGGWVIGALDEFDTLARKLAVATGFAVALVDYRLAPEAQFPAAVEDAQTALTWLDANLDALLGARLPLVIGGDSAGGNLTAVMARKAAENGTPTLLTQLLIYPVADSDFDTDSYTDPQNQLLLTREGMRVFFSHYVPEGTSREHPDISPLRAADLTGQVPALVITAEHDPLRDEGEALARRLEEAGVQVTRQRFAGQTHGFFTMANVLPGSDAGIALVADHLNTLLGK